METTTIGRSARHYLAHISIAILLLCTPASSMAQYHIMPDKEHLEYDVIYHWGVIWIKAATGSLSIERSGELYNATVTAVTTPFADGIMKVRDTLNTVMRAHDLMPLHYQQISREGKLYRVTDVEFIYRNDSTIGRTTMSYPLEGEFSSFDLSRNGDTFDMISIFYRLRQLPFNDMQAGDMIKTYIFSHRQIETLEVEYHGIQPIIIDDKEYSSYYIKFFFYNEDGSKKSDKISTWLSIENCIPLQVEGRLPIGSMKVQLRNAHITDNN